MDTVDPLRFLLAFAFVIGLIGLSALALRRYGRLLPGQAAAKEGQGRIAVLETRTLDARRRLVLIRRDRAEHLLLLADNRELVIESWEADAPISRTSEDPKI